MRAPLAVPVSALALAVACGGATSPRNGGATGGVPGSGGTGGAAGSGGVAGSGGAGGAAGSGGVGGVAGSGGAGGVAGCAGLDFCDCSVRAGCSVLSEPCFCPCGERCQPDCACVCGGGSYLGCTASSITAPGQLAGIWLVGWSGGLNHYSWVRFASDGTAMFLDGSAIGTNAPYWPCNGAGSWLFSQKPETVFLTMPVGCSVPADTFTFTGFKAPQGFPKAAVLGATLEAPTPATPTPLEAWKFPDAQCNARLTVCTDPLGFPP